MSSDPIKNRPDENGAENAAEGNGLSAGPDTNGDLILPDRPDGFLVVGLGASAGGIQALREFFAHVPADSDIAYVVVLHLSPDHDSKLAEVLQQTAKIPVRQVKDRETVQPNHAYVVPPDKHLALIDGYLELSQNTTLEDRRAPVDIFFRTLGDSLGPRAVAVVLSGTGANGSMGIKRVKELGGAAFVQNPREAEFSEMPRNSIATELIDEVLPAAEIPGRIIEYKNGLGQVQIEADVYTRPEKQQKALREIFSQLRVRTGHDFSNYKRPTLLRRIERRVNINALTDLPSYADLIGTDANEAQALLKDLLISVTNFFRDKDSFEYLGAEIMPRILKGKTHEDQVRMWCVGCATGEEAYSIAMLFAEAVGTLAGAPKLQIFATDIDDSAIGRAREARYTLNDVADVSPERLARFFVKDGELYRVSREIREMVLFANHNVIKDPPFSHLDLITCRNLLIYMNGQAKERAMETFHFALEPNGYLFLGSSESVDGASDLYASVNREHHVYQRRPTPKRSYPVPEAVPAFRFGQASQSAQSYEKTKVPQPSFADLHHQLLERYAPPSVVVNERYDVVHISDQAGKYLQVAGGEPSKNILDMVLPELRLELRSALFRAVQRRTNVEARNLPVKTAGGNEFVNIHAKPVLRADDPLTGFILIMFEPTEARSDERPLLTSDEPIVRQLEEELTRAKSELRSAIERYELQADELKASNEELQAMNEELRSAAEELETSKEELQSINEELRTVNQELKVKVEETTIASNNLQNLINSTDIGTIFLDRGLRVMMFTPTVRKVFNLIPSDHGRLLSDITSNLTDADITHDAELVLETLQAVEREVTTADGNCYLLRVLPYRTAEDRINGVVVTMVDVTELKKAHSDLSEQADELTRFNTVLVGREQRMIELKEEVNDLSRQMGEPDRYNVDFDGEERDKT